jgi:hypothetical protein
MAKARVYEAKEVTANGDDFTETRPVIFFGAELRAVDSSLVSVTIANSDSLAQQRSKLVAAVKAEGSRLGYNINQVFYPEMARG